MGVRGTQQYSCKHNRYIFPLSVVDKNSTCFMPFVDSGVRRESSEFLERNPASRFLPARFSSLLSYVKYHFFSNLEGKFTNLYGFEPKKALFHENNLLFDIILDILWQSTSSSQWNLHSQCWGYISFLCQSL
jgi:hypothetical protein